MACVRRLRPVRSGVPGASGRSPRVVHSHLGGPSPLPTHLANALRLPSRLGRLQVLTGLFDQCACPSCLDQLGRGELVLGHERTGSDRNQSCGLNFDNQLSVRPNSLHSRECNLCVSPYPDSADFNRQSNLSGRTDRLFAFASDDDAINRPAWAADAFSSSRGLLACPLVPERRLAARSGRIAQETVPWATRFPRSPGETVALSPER